MSENSRNGTYDTMYLRAFILFHEKIENLHLPYNYIRKVKGDNTYT